MPAPLKGAAAQLNQDGKANSNKINSSRSPSSASSSMAIIDSYKAWVRQNHEFFASLENIFNTLSWLLPERYTSSEVVPEAVAAILGLITTLNQHILYTSSPPSHSCNLPGNGLANDFERRCLPLSSSLSAVKQIEVFIEVAAEHYKGRDNKWNILAATEAIKACLRFAILHQNRYRMLLNGGEIVHEETGSNSKSSGIDGRHSRQYARARMAMSKYGVNSTPSWTNRRQHLECSTVHKAVDEEPCLKKQWELHDELSAVGEWVFILRPLVYVLLIKRYGLMSWKPWLCSLALETTSVATVIAAEVSKYKQQSDNYQQLSKEEIQEIKRRQYLLLLYLARDPFFSIYTRPCLDATARTLRPVPFIGGKLLEILSGVQSRYFYTSGS